MVENFFREYGDIINYNCFYRGEVIEVVDVDNGLYKVLVYPVFVDIDKSKIPVAYSNLTNRLGNVKLKKGDWVWVFFECGNLNLPIIFDLCNVKVANEKFKNVKSDGAIRFNVDDIEFELDKENLYLNNKDKKINVKVDFKNNEIEIIDDKMTLSNKDNNCIIKINFKNSEVEVISNKVTLTDKNNNCLIKMDNKIIIQNNFESLYNIISKIYEKLSNLMTIGNIISYTGTCSYVVQSDLVEINTMLKLALDNFLSKK